MVCRVSLYSRRLSSRVEGAWVLAAIEAALAHGTMARGTSLRARGEDLSLVLMDPGIVLRGRGRGIRITRVMGREVRLRALGQVDLVPEVMGMDKDKDINPQVPLGDLRGI